MRPKQWLKNLLVAAAPAAAGVLTRPTVLARTSLAVGSFCLVSAAMYLCNDVADAEADRRHRFKRTRPVASGEVSPGLALAAATALTVTGFAAGLWLGAAFVGILAAYVALALSYTTLLKGVVILDLAAVTAGFILRAVAGGVATGVPNSSWFLILTSFGALFVVAGKRYAEVRASETPDVPAEYTPRFLALVCMAATTIAIVAYCLWAFAKPEPHGVHFLIELSIIPFVLAVLRYALRLDAGDGGAPEEVLLGDPMLLALSLTWLAVYGIGIYLGH